MKYITLALLMLTLTVSTVYAVDYTYDNLNRLVSVRYDEGTVVTYTYDAGGNITSVTTSKDGEKSAKNLTTKHSN